MQTWALQPSRPTLHGQEGRGALYICVYTGHASKGVHCPGAALQPVFCPFSASSCESVPAPRGSLGSPSPSPCAVGLVAPGTSQKAPRRLLPH